MLNYYHLPNNPTLAREVWNAERDVPRWLKRSSDLWTPTFEAFYGLWKRCEKYGLYDNESLAAVVYLELLTDKMLNIHISVIRKVPERDLIRFFESLKVEKAQDGYEIMMGWLLEQNRPMMRVAKKSGFEKTGLVRIEGSIGGRACRWAQMRAI